MQSLFKSALILDYSMCMIWTLKKKETNSSEVFCSQLWPQGQHGVQPPAPASYLLQDEAKAKTEVAAARGDSIREKA